MLIFYHLFHLRQVEAEVLFVWKKHQRFSLVAKKFLERIQIEIKKESEKSKIE